MGKLMKTLKMSEQSKQRIPQAIHWAIRELAGCADELSATIFNPCVMKPGEPEQLF